MRASRPGGETLGGRQVRRLYPKDAVSLVLSHLNDRDVSVTARAAAYFCAYPDRDIIASTHPDKIANDFAERSLIVYWSQ